MDKTLATGAELDQATFDDFVQRLRHHVRGEGVNWHHTADALFTVQEKKILFGIDRDYADKLAVAVEDSMYFSPKEYWDASDDSMRTTLDDMAYNEHDKPFLMIDVMDQWDLLADLDDHTVSGWDESWEYVNSHFTKEAAEAFIRRKKHDYPRGLRVYVEANIYCWEFNAIVKGLIEGKIVHAAALAKQVPAQEQDWQPIKTAPKDTALLLYCDSYFELGHFNIRLNRWVDLEKHRGLRTPTHWMQLPPAPAQLAQSADKAEG